MKSNGASTAELLEGDGLVTNIFYFFWKYQKLTQAKRSSGELQHSSSSSGNTPNNQRSKRSSFGRSPHQPNRLDTTTTSSRRALLDESTTGLTSSAPKLLEMVSLPSTVIFEHNYPKAWYYHPTSSTGPQVGSTEWGEDAALGSEGTADVGPGPQGSFVPGVDQTERRLGKDIESAMILRDFCSLENITTTNNNANSSMLGAQRFSTENSHQSLQQQILFGDDGTSSQGEDERVVGAYFSHTTVHGGETATRVEYLNKRQLALLLYRRSRRPDGMLQKWVEPQGKNNSLIQVLWSPHMCLTTKRQNNLAVHDERYPIYDRVVTYEGPSHLSTESFVAPHIEYEAKHACQEFVQYIQNAHKIQLQRLVLYFKVDVHSKLWLLWCSCARATHHRVPMNLTHHYVRFGEYDDEKETGGAGTGGALNDRLPSGSTAHTGLDGPKSLWLDVPGTNSSAVVRVLTLMRESKYLDEIESPNRRRRHDGLLPIPSSSPASEEGSRHDKKQQQEEAGVMVESTSSPIDNQKDEQDEAKRRNPTKKKSQRSSPIKRTPSSSSNVKSSTVSSSYSHFQHFDDRLTFPKDPSLISCLRTYGISGCATPFGPQPPRRDTTSGGVLFRQNAKGKNTTSSGGGLEQDNELELHIITTPSREKKKNKKKKGKKSPKHPTQMDLSTTTGDEVTGKRSIAGFSSVGESPATSGRPTSKRTNSIVTVHVTPIVLSDGGTVCASKDPLQPNAQQQQHLPAAVSGKSQQHGSVGGSDTNIHCLPSTETMNINNAKHVARRRWNIIRLAVKCGLISHWLMDGADWVMSMLYEVYSVLLCGGYRSVPILIPSYFLKAPPKISHHQRIAIRSPLLVQEEESTDKKGQEEEMGTRKAKESQQEPPTMAGHGVIGTETRATTRGTAGAEGVGGGGGPSTVSAERSSSSIGSPTSVPPRAPHRPPPLSPCVGENVLRLSSSFGRTNYHQSVEFVQWLSALGLVGSFQPPTGSGPSSAFQQGRRQSRQNLLSPVAIKLRHSESSDDGTTARRLPILMEQLETPIIAARSTTNNDAAIVSSPPRPGGGGGLVVSPPNKTPTIIQPQQQVPALNKTPTIIQPQQQVPAPTPKTVKSSLVDTLGGTPAVIVASSTSTSTAGPTQPSYSSATPIVAVPLYIQTLTQSLAEMQCRAREWIHRHIDRPRAALWWFVVAMQWIEEQRVRKKEGEQTAATGSILRKSAATMKKGGDADIPLPAPSGACGKI